LEVATCSGCQAQQRRQNLAVQAAAHSVTELGSPWLLTHHLQANAAYASAGFRTADADLTLQVEAHRHHQIAQPPAPWHILPTTESALHRCQVQNPTCSCALAGL
jgi:hypothetical protein